MANTSGAEPTTPSIVEPVTVEPKAEQAVPETTQAEPEKDAEFWKGKAKAIEKENAKAFKRLADLEKKEKEREEAELSETEKLRKQLAEVEQKAIEAERRAIRQKIAAETGLPAVLAERLQGNDEDAMREDAAKILDALPKPDAVKKTNPNINPTNPAGAEIHETLAQKKVRLGLTKGFDLFSQSTNESLGGGVLQLGDKGE